MGKATKRKQEEFEAQQPDFAKFLLQSKEAAEKKHAEIESFDPLIAIRGYENYALKSLEHFTPRTRSLNTSTRVRELVRYAFNKYNLPGFLYQVWDPEFKQDQLRIFPNIKEDFRHWYIALAQGKSLYKEHTMGILTKKETHYFSTCPYTFTIPEAIWYSVIRGLNEAASPSLAKKIASTKISNESVTDFWRGVAQWFMTHQTSAKNMNDLLDYIRNRHQANTEWHLRDMTLHNLERHMYTWHREMYRVRTMSVKYEKWQGIKVEDSVVERAQGTKKHTWWKFHQIVTGKELAEEGNKQHHCVSSYGAMCNSGQCSIWSLTFKDKVGNDGRALTIEVRGKSIVQARGYANRSPKTDESSVLKEWAAKTGFRLKGL
jgi:hypothetical protein